MHRFNRFRAVFSFLLLAILLINSASPPLYAFEDALPPPSALPPPPLQEKVDPVKAYRPSQDVLSEKFSYPYYVFSDIAVPEKVKKDKKKQQKKEEEKILFKLYSEDVDGNQEQFKKSELKIEELSKEETDSLLRRLPELPEEEKTAFRLPPNLEPEDRPKASVIESLDSEDKTPEVQTPQELTIVRKKPVGDVLPDSTIGLTFSEPMIEIGSAEEANKIKLPIEIKPETECDAMWLGTTTLVLKPKKPLKLATRYEVTVPQSVKSLGGVKIKDRYSWTFTTPGPELINACVPPTPAKRVVVALKFNQPIDSQSMLDKCDFKLNGNSIGIRLASKKEFLSAYKEFKHTIDNGLNSDGKHFAVTYKQKIKNDGKSLTFSLGEGIAPKDSKAIVSKTKAKFEISEVGQLKSAYKIISVTPKDKMIESNGANQIAISTTQLTDIKSAKKHIKITPEPKNLNFQITDYDKSIRVRADWEPEKKYVLTVSSSLRSKLGTKLGEDHRYSFETLPMNPQLDFFPAWADTLTVIPKTKGKKISFKSMNIEKVKVTAYKVAPKDWSKYSNGGYSFVTLKTKLKNFPELNSLDIDTSRERNKFITSELDVDDLFKNSDGNIVLVAEAEYDKSKKYNRSFNWQKDRLSVYTWLNRTSIGVDAVGIGNKGTVYVSELSSGKPIEDARVDLLYKEKVVKSGTTDKNGLFTYGGEQSHESLVPAVSYKGDIALTPQFSQSYKVPYLSWYAVTDRNLYKPGETLKVKGYLRMLKPGADKTIERADSKVSSIQYSLYAGSDPISEGVIKPDNYGAFDFSVALPEKIARIGDGRITLQAVSKTGNFLLYDYNAFHEINFRIEEFRKPKYEFNVKSNDTAKTLIGDTVRFTAEANYYAGPPLAGVGVSWNVNTRAKEFTPPKWSEYEFQHGYESIPYNQTNYQLDNATNAQGKSLLKLDLLKSTLEQPLAVTATATIQDEDRQTWTDKMNFVVHPGELYVGMKKNKNFYKVGDEAEIKLVAVDIDGNTVDADIDVAVIYDQAYNYKTKKTRQKKSILKEKVSLKNGKGLIKFKLEEGGSYSVTSRILDKKDRPNTTRISLWSTDFTSSYYDGRRQNAQLKLLAEKNEYQPGDTAKILVESPISPAEGYIVVNRNGIVSTTPIQLSSHQTSIDWPITKEHIPSMELSVRVNGKNGISAFGKTRISVLPVASNISINIDSPKEDLLPGKKISFALKVKDHKNTPLPEAQIALAVVDEAILALTGYTWADPKVSLFQGPYYELSSGNSRSYLEPQVESLNQKEESKLDLEAKRSSGDLAALPPPSSLPPPPAPGAPDSVVPPLPGGVGGDAYADEGKAKAPINLRMDLRSLAYFAPSVITDENGIAKVSFKLPDNVTRYRIMAMAAYDKNHFGYSDASITAKLPLSLKPSAPRFANFTDNFSLPILLLNNTDEEKTVNVAARASNLKFRESQGLKVKIKANQRAQLSFPVECDMPGKSTIQFALASEEFADGTTVEIPVYTPVAKETVATYGMLKGSKQAIVEKLAIPDMIVPESGQVSIEAASTQLPKLKDAFVYLKDYQHLCSEQLSARVLSLLALKPYWKQLEVKGNARGGKTDFATIIRKDLDELIGRQDQEGNIGLWKTGDNKWPYVTLQTVRAFVLARENDFKIPDSNYDLSISWLKNIEKHVPKSYGKESLQSLRAYALFIRHLMKDSDLIEAKRLYFEVKNQKERVSSELLSRLMPIFAQSSTSDYKETFDQLVNRVDETASDATIEDKSYGDCSYLMFYSPRRATAVFLESLLVADKENPLIPKLVRGLFASARDGKWQGTQENACALLALARYVDSFESSDADYVARVWLGDDLVSKEHMQSGSKTSAQSGIPSQFVKEEKGRENITIAKDGHGELYYRIGLSYCPMRFDKQEIDRGFSISRSYEAYDKKDAGNVHKDSKGFWHFKAGSLIKVKLRISSPAARYHVALTDPLAAGTEGVNVNLKGSAVSKQKNNWWDWWYTWYEHENMRDDRAEVYASRVNGGELTYEYYIQATTPGEFIIPAARVEEMYSAETFGASSIDHVFIE